MSQTETFDGHTYSQKSQGGEEPPPRLRQTQSDDLCNSDLLILGP